MDIDGASLERETPVNSIGADSAGTRAACDQCPTSESDQLKMDPALDDWNDELEEFLTNFDTPELLQIRRLFNIC
jgi:hypothetical protein